LQPSGTVIRSTRHNAEVFIVALFSRKGTNRQGKAAPLQVPDELALKAADQARAGNNLGSLETYEEAVDKIHTMCVVAQPGSRIRQPGPQDQGILDGFTSALAAVLSADAEAPVSSTVERTVAYLQQIAGEAGPESGRYLDAIDSIQATLQR
jgi:hypothetical protein